MSDLKAYVTALENFIRKLNLNKNITPYYVSEESSVLFSLLNVGKVEITFEERTLKELEDFFDVLVYYDSGKLCAPDVLTGIQHSNSGMRIIYHIYRLADAPAWTDEERERLLMLHGLIHSYFARNNLVRIVHQLTFQDREMEIYNRLYFMKMLGERFEKKSMAGCVAIRFNLKRFAAVNDQLGREKGTLVMRGFAKHLEKMLDTDAGEMICRLGGDNFLMLVHKPTLNTVLPALEKTDVPYDTESGECVEVSAYIGIYELTEPAVPPSAVMDRISLAAYMAKESKEKDIVFFDESMMQLKNRNARIINMFPKAIQNRELQVYYQPKVLLENYQLAGAEALCRWIQCGKVIPPGDFIPVLEQGMEICTLDFYMLDLVCGDIRRWLDTGRQVVPVSVNLSRRHMADANLLQHILEIVDKHNVPHKYIEIELTETTTDVEFRDLKRIVSGLQAAGFLTAVDDFGVGYSSLTLIKDIPWDVLKIDKSLLPEQDDEMEQQKRIMYKYVLLMAREMGIACITEGVEYPEQLALLLEGGCGMAQGFLFDRPLCVSDFEERLDRRIYQL